MVALRICVIGRSGEICEVLYGVEAPADLVATVRSAKSMVALHGARLRSEAVPAAPCLWLPLMPEPPSAIWSAQLQAHLAAGELQQARSLAYHWLQGHRRDLPLHPERHQLRQPLLWRALGDVVERTGDQYLLELFWQMLDEVAPAAWCESNFHTLPLLGVPLLNRPDLLLQLLESLDVPVATLAVVDNSSGSAAEAEVSAVLDRLERHGHPLVGDVRIARSFGNAGVAASWNLILRSFPEAPMALIINNDVQLMPGVLAQALQRMDPQQAQMLPLLPVPQEFSAFLITACCWNRIGLFDPSFHPAYCEDLEYRDRLRAERSVHWLQASDLQALMAAGNSLSSATIESDPQLKHYNLCSFALNRLWYLSHRRLQNDRRGTWMRQWLCAWSD